MEVLKMSKPLTFVLELGGAIVLILGVLPPVNVFMIVIGSVMILAGAIGIRKRLKKTT